MDAKALIVHEDQSFSIEAVRLAEIGPNDTLVRTVSSGVSIGTEFALVRRKLDWGPYPLCTGYQNTGIVERVGSEVTHLKPGDRVFTRGNRQPVSLLDGTPVSCSVSHASYTVCDASADSIEGPGLVPEAVDMGTASMFVMPAVALHGVDMAQPTALDTVAAYGVGQIGIGVVALASLRGCRVIALDVNDKALELARAMGAEHLINVSDSDWKDQFDALVPDGADVVFENTGIPACLDVAVELTRRTPAHLVDGNAKFVFQGNYGAAPITTHFLPSHERQLRTFYPCSDGLGPNRERVMRLLATGALKWEMVITHRLPYTEAPAVFKAINKGEKEFVGVILNWSEA